MGKEPAVIFKGIEEILRAAIPMAILFGWITWNPEQIAAVTLFGGLVLGFISMTLTRSQVISTEKANAQIETAIRMPSSATVEQVIEKENRDSQ